MQSALQPKVMIFFGRIIGKKATHLLGHTESSLGLTGAIQSKHIDNATVITFHNLWKPNPYFV